ncbi:MAG: PAS domain-containing protein, partial [Candidatus Eisenbacteria bacterium]|nr:PAS domain-containing protein [Candidatus Eisenbacteria bacterium]
MDKPVPDDPAQEVSDLRRRVADLERWFKLQDSQIRLLERERQKLAALVHHTDIAYLVLDRDLRVTWTNRAFKEHWSRLGVGGDAVGRSCSDVLCQQSDRCMSCPCGFSFRSRDVVHLESLRKIGGEERYFYISAMPIQDPSGEIDEVIVMLQDFTDLEALRKSQESLQAAKDAAEAANRAKSEFVANVSHEIRTPMNGVLGMTELLMAGTLTPSQQECARIAHESSVALLAIINDILDFSKMEASRFELEHLDFTIAELLEGLIRLLRPQAEKKGLALDVRLDPAVPRQVNGDPFRLRQVLLNLGSNAIKFTARGTVSIAVDLEREPDPALPTESDHDASTTSSSCILRFTVRDSGIGVSRDKVPYLFEPFSQADASTTRRFGGTGLGLAICRRLVELMGGAIWVESTPGQGSTFHFTLLT